MLVNKRSFQTLQYCRCSNNCSLKKSLHEIQNDLSIFAQIIKMTTITIQLEVAADFGSLSFLKLHKTSAFHMRFLLIGLFSWIRILTFVFENLSGFNLSSTRENTSSEFQRTVLWHTRWLYRLCLCYLTHPSTNTHTHTHPPTHS